MSKVKDSLYGFVIGDAMGVPVEFVSREELSSSPVTTMIGYGTYNVAEGVWSDDTSMTLATMDSIGEYKELNYRDIMDKFLLWYGKSKYTATNKVFDIGNATYKALLNYAEFDYEPCKCGLNDFKDNGNGSLMRMLPIAFYCYYKKLDDSRIYNVVKDVSSFTHSHEISVLGCYLYVMYLINILKGFDKYQSLEKLKKIDLTKFDNLTIKEYSRIFEKDFINTRVNDIYSTGYIVYTLEAVLWVILNADSFEQAIIGAINLGDDTDTVGAITGSIAGLIYGYESIPSKWIDKIKNKELLEEILKKFENVFLKEDI